MTIHIKIKQDVQTEIMIVFKSFENNLQELVFSEICSRIDDIVLASSTNVRNL